jgi:two-component system, chemotaxis family, chemotaxis protein CheY
MKRRILVIEDDAAVRTTLQMMLAGIGYEVVCAIDGKEGVRMFQASRPDLVITDIIMPEREGIETIIIIKSLEPRTKIIAMSASGRIGDTDFRELAVTAGADQIVAKPFEHDELINLVRRSLPA